MVSINLKSRNNLCAIFIDFDGVIKESVLAKGEAFCRIFAPHDAKMRERIRQHHTENSGTSRRSKIPLYLSWVGMHPSQNLVADYEARFSEIVVESVISSKWVPGVRKFLEFHSRQSDIHLLSATPQPELSMIINKLGIRKLFTSIRGSPSNKRDSIKQILEYFALCPTRSIMIGDSKPDLDAAMANEVMFFLRRTSENKRLQGNPMCVEFDDFASYK